MCSNVTFQCGTNKTELIAGEMIASFGGGSMDAGQPGMPPQRDNADQPGDGQLRGDQLGDGQPGADQPGADQQKRDSSAAGPVEGDGPGSQRFDNKQPNGKHFGDQ